MTTIETTKPRTERPVDPIRVLIVDDERLGRERLQSLLGGEPEVEIVGQCANGLQALAAITGLSPELVFLDVHMPDLDGLGVIDALGCANDTLCPEIVFVTAHDAYMERAFEVHAVDYLRKPYTNARFYSALAFARKRVLARRLEPAEPAPSVPTAARYASVVASVQPEREGARVAVQDRQTGIWHIVSRDEIDWIEADGAANVRLHRGAESYQWRKTLAELEQELAPHGFLRVHRSCIVNGARIRAVKPLPKGEYALFLEAGGVVDTGRTYRDVVERFLQHVTR